MRVILVVLSVLFIGTLVRGLASEYFTKEGVDSPATFKDKKADESSGSCGNNLAWAFDHNSFTLTITGNGDMTCCHAVDTPWSQFRNETRTVIIEQGVTSIDYLAFYMFRALSTVSIPDSVFINRKLFLL